MDTKSPAHRKKLLNCLRIGKLWYGILMSALQIYTHYTVFDEYINFKQQVINPRYGFMWNTQSMDFILISAVLSLSLMPYFVYSCLVKTGNLINDDIHLGDPKMYTLLPETSYFLKWLRNPSSKRKLSQKLKYHLCPSSQTIHFISSFMLLVPSMFLQSERMRNSALNKKYLWVSDLHSIFNIHDLKGTIIIRHETEKLRFPMSTVNFVTATIFLSLQTSAVFWKVSKSFAAIIAIFDSCISFSFLLIQAVLRVSMRYFIINPFASKKALYTQWECCAFLFGSFVIYLICRNVIFHFGVSRYIVSQNSYNEYLEETKVPSLSSGLLQNSKDFQDRIRSKVKNMWLNISAIVLWLLEAGCLLPLSCYFIAVLWTSKHSFILFGFISTLVILFVWFSILMLMFIKQNWIFKVTSRNISSDVTSYVPDIVDPIYTCFQAHRALSRCSNNSDHTSGYVKNDRFNQFTNNGDYLYEDHRESDIYQLFRLPSSNYQNGTLLNNTNTINSNVPINNKSNSLFNMIDNNNSSQGRPVNANGKLLNEICENQLTNVMSNNNVMNNSNGNCQYRDTLDHRSIMTQINNTSLDDSDYHSVRNKHFSLDSLKSLPTYRRNTSVTNNDYKNVGARFENPSFTARSINSAFQINKREVNGYDDNNTDISTDFSDQNTNSSGVEVTNKCSGNGNGNGNRQYPIMYEQMYDISTVLQQTGV